MSRVEFRRFPFEEKDFPSPLASMLPGVAPAIAWRALTGRRRVSVFDTGAFHVRARYALREAFRLFGVRAEHDQVLMPAYHCRTMIDPLIRAGGTPSFYRVREDLSVDLRHLAERIEAGQGGIRCAVVPHFFGRRQPMEAIRDLLDQHEIPLIEDCAHVLRPDEHGHDMGFNGTVSIFCPAKFLPCPDGGILFAESGIDEVRQPSVRRTWTAELRLLARVVTANTAMRGHGARPTVPGDGARTRRAIAGDDSSRHREIDTGAVDEGRSPLYNPARECLRASYWSRRIIGQTDLMAVRDWRRRNYLWWLEAVEDLPSCRAFFREMDAAMAPYVFPLILEEPTVHFERLKRAGMPMYRWDELAVTDCSNSAYFREHLVQLPCHQDLGGEQLQELLRTLRRVLGTGSSGVAAA